MKKYLFIFITFLFILPISVSAQTGIENFYIDATILSNGDIKVRETFIMNGSFNGFERIINYRNSNAKKFNANSEYYGGSSIHNGTGINVNKVGGINIYNGYDYNIINNDVDYFTYNDNASKGDYGYYYTSRSSEGISIMIYNPSRKNKAFYIEYTLEGMAIRHNDVAEFGWNMFTELSESVGHFEMYINIPNNQNEMRVWAHGPLHGNSEIINKTKAKFEINNLNANTNFDVRLTFDLSVINNSTKKTNVNALDKILYYEENQAEIANKEREEERKQLLLQAEELVKKAETILTRKNYNNARYFIKYNLDDGEEKEALVERLSVVLNKIINREQTINDIIYFLLKIWFIGLIFALYKHYNKHDKEYKASFEGKYFRDFPATYGPEIVEYLFDKRIDEKALSSAILNLIADKVASVESVGSQHTLIYNPTHKELNESDKHLVKWLFSDIGSDNRLDLYKFKKEASKSYTDFLSNYNAWKTLATSEAKKHNFYENKNFPISLFLYLLLGCGAAYYAKNNHGSVFVFIGVAVVSIISLIYLLCATKRTVNGNDEYAKWNGLKNFIKDFGCFKERDLPEIKLWEKYLVYAHVFGLSKKLAETMKIKINELSQSGTYTGDFADRITYVNVMTDFNRVVSDSVRGAVNSANSAYAAAHSSSSSGYGGGGGFSSGGGSFGGGGGGGRF